MKALVEKEIRLVSPAFWLALALAIVPAWLLPGNSVRGLTELVVLPFCLGMILLSLSTFGREFGLKTFSLFLGQPVERRRIWWTKVSVVGVATVLVGVAWCLSWAARVAVGLQRPDWPETLALAGGVAAVAFAGGLWTTLLLRQVAAAFWSALLIPCAILMTVDSYDGGGVAMLVALGIYSVLAFWWAWRHFLRLQEAGWTGGEVALPLWRGRSAAERQTGRIRRPVAALFWKELQLHQIGLGGMACLFLMHLVVVWLRKDAAHRHSPSMQTVLEVFPGLWLIVPLLIGSSSIAEERKLGTLDAHLSLPVSRRVQYVLKLVLVVALGGLLSGLLLWTAEGLGVAIHARGALEPTSETVASVWFIFLGLSLIAFYASSVSRSFLQAIGVGVLLSIALALLNPLVADPGRFGFQPWRGNLVYIIGCPTLVVMLLWLAYRNYRSLSERGRFWRRNVLGIASALVFIFGATVLLYNRAWELILPLEPAHGPARLAGPKLPEFHGHTGALLVLTPEGRVWVDRPAFYSDWGLSVFGAYMGVGSGPRLVSLTGGQFIPGSNWVAAAASFRHTLAIRSDGTLWVSETPISRSGRPGGNRLAQEQPLPLRQHGSETDWRDVAWDYSGGPVLLKTDGTLWRWAATTRFGTGEAALPPEGLSRIGTGTDWEKIMPAGGSIYAWTRDGHAWITDALVQTGNSISSSFGPVRVPMLDHTQWRCLADASSYYLGVRADGTLWAWNRVFQSAQGTRRDLGGSLVQVGKDSDWLEVAGANRSFVALKSDGTLWRWNWDANWYNESVHFGFARQSPARLGVHNDWVGLGNTIGTILSLAADGGLWYWWEPQERYYDAAHQPLLANSRKPAKLGNIFRTTGGEHNQ